MYVIHAQRNNMRKQDSVCTVVWNIWDAIFSHLHLSKIEGVGLSQTKHFLKFTVSDITFWTDVANLEHESESTNLTALYILLMRARHLFYTAAIFFLSFSLFPILNLVKAFAIVSCGDWAVRTVLSRSNLASIEWGSRPQKNGWVANRSLGEQTNTTQPACVKVKCFFFLPLGQLYTNTSPFSETKLKCGLMAGNNIATILNQSKTGNWLKGCNITSNHLFSSLLCHLRGDFESRISFYSCNGQFWNNISSKLQSNVSENGT